jgi:predicted HD phosphohydrolase
MADDDHGPRAQFHSIEHGTKEDWRIINQAMKPFIMELPDRVLAHLKMLEGDCGGFAIDRLDHCLQTATRAFKDGRDEEYVVCALLHDMGDLLGPRNHADVAAAILKPFVSEQNHWMVEKHAIFQGYYFFHHLGLDRDMREQFRAHPWYDYCADFCREYDGPAFDPKYKFMALEEFEPMVRKVLTNVKNSIYVPKQGKGDRVSG